MRPQKPFPAGTTGRMEQLLRATNTLSEYRRIQIIYFRSKYGYNATQIAKMVGLETQTVRNIQSAYLKQGELALCPRGQGGRRRFNLSIEEEEAFLSIFELDGEMGDMLEVDQVHRYYERQIGRKAPKSTVYRLLHRHGWRKLAPHPKHPKGDKEVVKHFKKTSEGS